MTAATESGEALPALAPEGSPRPWHYATLVIVCPDCGAQPGSKCIEKGRSRSRAHLGRYELARTLAGLPIRRSTT